MTWALFFYHLVFLQKFKSSVCLTLQIQQRCCSAVSASWKNANMRTAHRNKHSKMERILNMNWFLVPNCMLGKGRAYMGPSGTESICAIINLCSENISILSTKEIPDTLTVLSFIGWLLSDLSFIGWLLLMRTYKLKPACPTVLQQISLSPQSGKASLFPLSLSPVLFFLLQASFSFNVGYLWGQRGWTGIRVCSARTFIIALRALLISRSYGKG